MNELYLRLLLTNGSVMYMELWFSDNPPYDSNNFGCIGIQLYDSHMLEYDGGELDYPTDTIQLKDMIDDCIKCMGIDVKEYKETKMLKLIER